MKKETATKKWIEEFRKWLEKETGKRIYDRDIHKMLDVSRSSFSGYINEERTMPDDMAMEIAHYMQIPVMRIIGEINAEKAKNDKIKRKWLKLSKNAVATIGSIGFIGIMTATIPNTKIEAGQKTTEKTNKTVYTLYELKLVAKKWYECSLKSLSAFTQLILKEFYKCKNLEMNF